MVGKRLLKGYKKVFKITIILHHYISRHDYYFKTPLAKVLQVFSFWSYVHFMVELTFNNYY